jgi:hypothetical protein
VSNEQQDFWFHAKRFGWGWGLPARWQGWLVLAVYLALIIAGHFIVPDYRYQLIYLFVITVMLIVVAAFKGEKPLRWRWGKHRERR